MIPLARDTSSEAPLTRTLKTVWFVAAATALPLLDFIRSSSRLSLAGALLGGLFLTALAASHLYIVRVGPQQLAYEERFRDVIVYTALKQLRVPIRAIAEIDLFDGTALRYRHGVSVPGYHVGTFVAPDLGRIDVAASSLASTGLLLSYRARHPFRQQTRWLYLSPEEPLAVKLALEDLIAEHHWRVALGQP